MLLLLLLLLSESPFSRIVSAGDRLNPLERASNMLLKLLLRSTRPFCERPYHCDALLRHTITCVFPSSDAIHAFHFCLAESALTAQNPGDNAGRCFSESSVRPAARSVSVKASIAVIPADLHGKAPLPIWAVNLSSTKSWGRKGYPCWLFRRFGTI